MKRLFAFLLSAVLAFGAAASVYAESSSFDMQSALIKAKSIINVPSEYSQFSYDVWQSDISGTVWNFTWSKTDGNGQISVGINDKGNLKNFDKWDDSTYQNGISEFTKADGEKVALKFLLKAAPYLKDSVKLTNTYSYTGDSQISYEYTMLKNGITVDFTNYNISISKYTGEVTSFYAGEIDPENLSYPDVSGKISEGEAKEAFTDKIGIELKYYIYSDYNDKTRKVFAAYTPSDKTSRFAIDAITGEAIEFYYQNYYATDEGAKGSVSETKSIEGEALTPEEIKGIEEESKLISKDEALKIVQKYVNLSNNSEAYLNPDYFDKSEYTWNLYFENGYASVDAKTGELLDFSRYNYEKSDKDTKISIEDAKAEALALIKKLSPDKALKVKFSEDNTSYEYAETYTFRFSRYENGIECATNYISVDVNMYTKEIENYNSVWYKNVSFPSVKPVLNESAAFDKVKAASSFEPVYTLNKENKVVAVYKFLNNSVYIDPVKGTRLDSTGNVYTEEKEAKYYDDISGHWSESTVSLLFENGVYLEGDSFYPEKVITQGDFLKYLYMYSFSYRSLDNIYDKLIEQGAITEDEKNPDALLTRKEAAKFICAYLGYDKLGKKADIFKNPFKDNNDPEYSGYVIICEGLGIINENGGYVRGEDSLKRGEAAVMVLNTLYASN
ncbi:MAG: S-layer homology domain-containing protein [Lachnospiraceae bacterium]|nr:S-layer homology domain-containing protein [Lachnospiraceae bacterium]